jgi:hypothetical protein
MPSLPCRAGAAATWRQAFRNGIRKPRRVGGARTVGLLRALLTVELPTYCGPALNFSTGPRLRYPQEQATALSARWVLFDQQSHAPMVPTIRPAGCKRATGALAWERRRWRTSPGHRGTCMRASASKAGSTRRLVELRTRPFTPALYAGSACRGTSGHQPKKPHANNPAARRPQIGAPAGHQADLLGPRALTPATACLLKDSRQALDPIVVVPQWSYL